MAFLSPRLDFSAYFEPVLILEVLKRSRFLLLFGGSTLVLALLFPRVRWRSIDPRGRLRILILVLSGILVWTFSTYDYNYFYDQAHAVDRLILVSLWFALIFHPIAVPCLFGCVVMIASQMLYPLPMSSWYWPDKRLVLDLLCLCVFYLPVKAILGRRTSAHLFPFSALCLVGATYLHAAISKISLGPRWTTWLFENSLSNLFVSAHLNGGWLAFLSHGAVVEIAGWMQYLSFPLALGTLLVEASAILLLYRKSLCRVLLVGFVLMHLGILVSSGIFFWKWILFHFALIWFLGPDRDEETSSDRSRAQWMFGTSQAILAAVIMLALPRFVSFVPFAWLDSRAANFFVFEGVSSQEERYSIHPRFFAPYDLLIQQSRFFYLLKTPVLADTYGTIYDYELMKALEDASPSEALDLQRRFGRVWYHERAAASFAGFLRRFGSHAIQRGPHPLGPLRFLRPPYHFQSQTGPNPYRFQEDLAAIEVFFESYLFTGEEIVLLERRPVLRVTLDSESNRR